jgi:hypothetical protein
VPNFPAVAARAEIVGPWDVQFASGDATLAATFDTLQDWAQQQDTEIRHYAGRATYRKVFPFAGESAASSGTTRLWLDLGAVRDVAVVRLNGRDLGTLWTPPWRVDVTDVVQRDANVLEVDVINVWNNRLVADAALPADQRRTTLLLPTVTPETPLLPAGLLGPVRILATSSADSATE